MLSIVRWEIDLRDYLLAEEMKLEILRQPNDVTCGPTCLHAIYTFYGDDISLQQVIAEVSMIENGGTFASLLGSHALERGYAATLYTYNLQVFDPTWFTSEVDIQHKLSERLAFKSQRKLKRAISSYLDFIASGGEVKLQDLTPNLIRKFLNNSQPILTGLSSTFLYRTVREFGPKDEEDDIRGEPTGHFVVLSGYDHENREVLVNDPLYDNPYSHDHQYHVSIYRLISAILIGVLTYDGNLLIIEPKE